MTCCAELIITFTGQATTDIPYANEFGAKPMVTVLYFIDGEWQTSGVFTTIKLQGNPTNNIHIDHGGIASGVVKVS